MADRYLEDMTEGETTEIGRHRVSRDEIVRFARDWDPQPFHLDEEAARLIEFQQSYQAAAKVLQVAQSVFDTLLEVTRG